MRLKIVAKRSILETLTNHGRGLIIKEQKYCPLRNFDYFLETRISRNFPQRLLLEMEPLEIVGWKLLGFSAFAKYKIAIRAPILNHYNQNILNSKKIPASSLFHRVLLFLPSSHLYRKSHFHPSLPILGDLIHPL